MKRNWILFILICIIAYIWMISDQMQKQQEYEKKMED